LAPQTVTKSIRNPNQTQQSFNSIPSSSCATFNFGYLRTPIGLNYFFYQSIVPF
jgi:hypothetical protein